MKRKTSKVSKEELLMELTECREDERNCKDQMVQVIATASTILGILFGSTYFSFGENEKKSLYFSKIVFYLSITVFCVAFTYIIVLGIGSTLRYYYVQKLEDLLFLENKNTDFLHWGSYFAPIITRNRKHIRSMHTLLYYVCYTLSAICAIAFSAGTIIIQYVRIKNKTRIDNAILLLAVTGVIGTLLIFYRTTARAKSMALYAEKMARSNRKERLDSSADESNTYKAFRHYIRYFIYPKIQDLEKPLFIIGIFAIFSYANLGLQIKIWNWKNLLFSLIIFEGLAYQARYQINDLRDIGEDKDSNDRLFPKGVSKNAYIIELSAILAGIKIVLAFGLAYFAGDELRGSLYIELAALAIITIIYEKVRDTYDLNKICFWVGSGYSLRYIVAITAAQPMFFHNMNKKIWFCALTVISLWSMGAMASVAQWVAEAVKLRSASVTDYGKKHYTQLFESIEERYNLAKEKSYNGQIYPMREKGKLWDIWNFCFIFSFYSLGINVFIQKELAGLSVIVCELFTWLAVLMLIKWTSYKNKIHCNILILILILIKFWLMWKNRLVTGEVICILQCIVLETYFYVTYRPEFKKIDMKKLLVIIMRNVLGKEAADYIINDTEKKG